MILLIFGLYVLIQSSMLIVSLGSLWVVKFSVLYRSVCRRSSWIRRARMSFQLSLMLGSDCWRGCRRVSIQLTRGWLLRLLSMI